MRSPPIFLSRTFLSLTTVLTHHSLTHKQLQVYYYDLTNYKQAIIYITMHVEKFAIAQNSEHSFAVTVLQCKHSWNTDSWVNCVRVTYNTKTMRSRPPSVFSRQ